MKAQEIIDEIDPDMIPCALCKEVQIHKDKARKAHISKDLDSFTSKGKSISGDYAICDECVKKLTNSDEPLIDAFTMADEVINVRSRHNQ